MEINEIRIPESREQHIWQAHQVTPDDVYDVFDDPDLQIWHADDSSSKEHAGQLYWAYGRASNGRLLAVIFRYFPDRNAYVITVRDMDEKEKRRYIRR